ncbi:MAG: hypothetical protein FJX59_18840, partial [Alphaproteobacteria bacterium]|nr:hypothetical protein [Alphaproteobacteria bacterium]
MEVESVIAAKTKSPATAPAIPAADPSTAAGAFAALMRTAGFKFSSETGLSQVEGQFIRVRPVKEAAPEPKCRDAVDRPKQDRVPATDAKQTNDAPKARKADNDDATSAAKPTDATADQSDAATATIQFKVLRQLPTGETQQIAIVDLDTLLAVAEQNPDFAAAQSDAAT